MDQGIVTVMFIITVVILIIFIYLWKLTEDENNKDDKKNTKEEKESTETVSKKDKVKDLPSLDILQDNNSNFVKMLSKFNKEENKLLVPLGFINEKEDIEVIDLKDINNLIIIGTTGGGKSICINEILLSTIMNYKSSEVKIVSFDTSLVELSSFNGIPHYIKDTVFAPNEIISELEELQREIIRRKTKNDNQDLIVIIDDYYDIASISEKAKALLERIIEENKNLNTHIIITTDTPSDDIITDSLKNNLSASLYLTLSPGEEKYFELDKKLTNKDIDYITEIGNMIYISNDKKVKLKVPEVTDEEIRNVVKYYKY